jgi:diguanylate cyclase (GGDEF)-like protein
MRWRVVCLGLLIGCVWLLPRAAQALALELRGHWYRAEAQHGYEREARLPSERMQPIDAPGRTGGLYYYEADFTIEQAGSYVLDFRNSTTIGRFRHLVFDVRGKQVAELAGGIQSREENPYPIRHGRDLTLATGHYHLITELDSPFLLAQPEPFVQPQRDYRRDIKRGNALALAGIGVLCGLGFYYAALAISRRQLADLMYALFILGNVLYNGSSLLIFSDLIGLHWFYLVSVPILFSNAAYVVFAMALLEVDAHQHPLLYRAAVALLGVFAAFLVAAAIFPSWSLELDRFGVGLMTTYGLVAALLRARDGHSSARWYLIAISAFFVLGGASISLSRVGIHTLYVEHLGLLAVVVEAALLALVLAHQFALLHSEKTQAERRASEGFQIAHRDALTGLPNRYSLDKALHELPQGGSLTFIDLDGLKLYNDEFGHRKGDELLCCFADALGTQLGKRAQLYRLSGDEFAVTSESGEIAFVSSRIEQAVHALRATFSLAGASFGSVLVSEDPGRDSLKHIADTRMYENKRVRRASATQDHARDSAISSVHDTARAGTQSGEAQGVIAPPPRSSH